ncbi:MAG: polysaccharide biosynthesis tyrosine autokinase [Desulfobacteraceae bacterium]
MELKYFWNVILNSKFLIVQAVLIFMAAAGIMMFFLPSTYTSKGKIYINDNQDAMNSILSSIGLDDISGLLLKAGESDIEDECEQILLKPFVSELAKRLFIMDEDLNVMDPESIINPGLKEKIKGVPTLAVSTVSDTSMIEITASSITPREAKYMVDTIAEIFIDYTMARDTQQYKAAGQFLKNQLINAEKAYNQSLEALRIFQEEEGALDLSKEVELAMVHMADLMMEMEENRLELSETDAALNLLKKRLGEENPFIVSSETISKNELVAKVKQQIIDLKLEYEDKKVELTDHHPAMRSLKSQIKEAKKQLNQLVKEELETRVSSQNPMYRMVEDLFIKEVVKKSEIDIRNELIPQLLKKYERELSSFPQKIEKYSRLKLSLTVSEELYNSLLTYEKSIGVAQAMAISRVELIEPGSMPDIDSPEFPRKKLVFAIALFSGLLTGCGLAFLFDYFNNTIESLSDVTGLETINCLGHIPKLRKSDITKQGVLSETSLSTFSFEVYRSVRNNLQFILEEKQAKSFVVSSVVEGEGKTTTICNLAILFARFGLRVMVLDLDLRCPAVHSKLGLNNVKGVSTCVLKKLSYKEVIQTHTFKDSHFDILTSGPVPSEPDILIESDGLKRLVNQINESYDLVLIDSPPMLTISDAVVMGKLASHMVWVMDLKKVGRDSAEAVLKKIEKASVDVLGIVVNNQQSRKSDFYTNYYRKYYYGKGG